jgi:hypothetical protein
VPIVEETASADRAAPVIIGEVHKDHLGAHEPAATEPTSDPQSTQAASPEPRLGHDQRQHHQPEKHPGASCGGGSSSSKAWVYRDAALPFARLVTQLLEACGIDAVVAVPRCRVVDVVVPTQQSPAGPLASPMLGASPSAGVSFVIAPGQAQNPNASMLSGGSTSRVGSMRRGNLARSPVPTLFPSSSSSSSSSTSSSRSSSAGAAGGPPQEHGSPVTTAAGSPLTPMRAEEAPPADTAAADATDMPIAHSGSHDGCDDGTLEPASQVRVIEGSSVTDVSLVEPLDALMPSAVTRVVKQRMMQRHGDCGVGASRGTGPAVPERTGRPAREHEGRAVLCMRAANVADCSLRQLKIYAMKMFASS